MQQGDPEGWGYIPRAPMYREKTGVQFMAIGLFLSAVAQTSVQLVEKVQAVVSLPLLRAQGYLTIPRNALVVFSGHYNISALLFYMEM